MIPPTVISVAPAKVMTSVSSRIAVQLDAVGLEMAARGQAMMLQLWHEGSQSRSGGPCQPGRRVVRGQ